MLKGKRTLATNIAFLIFCGYLAWICDGNYTEVSALAAAAGVSVFGTKLANSFETRAENGGRKT